MADYAAAQIHVRDALLAEIIRKLERRRDTRPLAKSVQRLVSLITTLEAETPLPDAAERLTKVVGERIERFAALTGREKSPRRVSRPLRPLKIKLLVLTSHFRELQDEAPVPGPAHPAANIRLIARPPSGGPVPSATLARQRRTPTEWWHEQITAAWDSILHQKGTPPRSSIDAVVKARTPKGKAEALLCAAYGEPDEGLEDFRRKLARVELKLPV